MAFLRIVEESLGVEKPSSRIWLPYNKISALYENWTYFFLLLPPIPSVVFQFRALDLQLLLFRDTVYLSHHLLRGIDNTRQEPIFIIIRLYTDYYYSSKVLFDESRHLPAVGSLGTAAFSHTAISIYILY